MTRRHKSIRPVRLPALVGLGLVAMGFVEFPSALAGDGKAVVPNSERTQRIEDLKKQRDRLQQELNQLKQQPEGVSRSIVPRSELSDQPTRSMKESLESAPGVTVRQGQGGRDGNLSIRGSGK
ncbi:MAG: TonB-dependent receptor plug domain-containing protein [Nitrospira defluvii]|nr:TonB-dependent receptor plug domain-containing protein [Nitrospira defluvii]